MIQIANDGADIVSTNYWDTEAASAGLCYLSGNAGTWRLLVPEAAEGSLADMRTGTRATIERSIRMPGRCWDIVFQDGTPSPFCITLDKRMLDRRLDLGARRLAVSAARGKVFELECEVKV